MNRRLLPGIQELDLWTESGKLNLMYGTSRIDSDSAERGNDEGAVGNGSEGFFENDSKFGCDVSPLASKIDAPITTRGTTADNRAPGVTMAGEKDGRGTRWETLGRDKKSC